MDENGEDRMIANLVLMVLTLFVVNYFIFDQANKLFINISTFSCDLYA
jgi:hypothetical protein